MSESRSHRYVFVVTYGRSGSTLVQGLLNTMPGTLVRGENNFYVLPLYRAYELARSYHERYGKGRTVNATSAFFGMRETDPSDFVRTTRDLVERQLLGAQDPEAVDVLGFKEVLWHRIRKGEQAGFFDFLDQAFDRPRYVLNQRAHNHVMASGFWRRSKPGEPEKAIARVEGIQEFLRETRGDRCFDTRYESLTSADERVVREQVTGLAEFVAGSCDEELFGRLVTTLSVGHGPKPFQGQGRQR